RISLGAFLSGPREHAAVDGGRHEAHRARLEVGDRVVVQNDAVARRQQNLRTVPALPAPGSQLEVPDRIAPVLDRDRFRLHQRTKHTAPPGSGQLAAISATRWLLAGNRSVNDVPRP